jgi:ribonuclease T2
MAADPPQALAQPAFASFDQYVLALSWSPSYCALHPEDTEQCGHGGRGFVLHGFWPENRDGHGPQYCGNRVEPDPTTIRQALAILPSRRLIEHEWRAHGSCTGLDPAAYFQLAERAFRNLRIPAALSRPETPPRLRASDLVQLFLAANPSLTPAAIHLICHDGNVLREVRICLDAVDLAPRSCTLRDHCTRGELTIPAAQ